jgi:hypothetical protein
MVAAPGLKKASPVTIALTGVDAQSEELLLECFKHFGIVGTSLANGAAQRLQQETFDACVVTLQSGAEALLQKIRASAANKRTLIYGLAPDVNHLGSFTDYGINIVWHLPLDRNAVVKSLRSTHLMVLNELRKHARLPLVVPAEIESGSVRHAGSTREIGAGGVSIKTSAKLQTDSQVKVFFSLPGHAAWIIPATVCWKREVEEMLGFHFDAQAPQVAEVRHWVEQYLA